MRRYVPHAGQELERALPGQFVRRGTHEPQERSDVLDVALLEKAKPAPDLEGNPPAGEFHLKFHRVVVRPVEHRDLGERHVILVAQRERAVDHEVRLLHGVARGHEGGLHSLAARGFQVLLELPPVVRDGGVGEGQNVRRAPVVFFEAKKFGVRVSLGMGKSDDVLEVSAPETVDALRIVPHHGDVFLRSRQQVQQFGLHLVRVLIFIHEDVAKARLEFPPHLFVFGEQIPREGEEAREIHRLNLFFSLLVVSGDLLHLAHAVRQV